jgi:hypothetical protein
MGMFDSFLVEVAGRAVWVQTKRFDRVLGRYRLGDVVSGAAPGVQVFTDQLDFDATGRLVYGDADAVSRWTLFVVLGFGFFAHYEVEGGELSAADTLARIRRLAETWQDSARLMARMVQSLGEKQGRIEQLEGRLSWAASTLADARKLRAGETLPDGFLPDREATRRLKAGDDPLDVLEGLLADDAVDETEWSFAGPFQLAATDPLEPYRL